MAGGDFSPEAYEALREAYADQQQEAVDVELAGHEIMNLNLGLETGPVDSPWADKIDRWEYPSGRGQHMDERQSPEEILEVMRQAAQERIEAREEAEEEIEEEETETEEEEEISDEALMEMSDEEFDAYIDKIVGEVEDDSEEDDDDYEDEEESEAEEVEEAEESEVEEEVETEEDLDAVAEQIAALRAEMEQLRFVQDQPEEVPSDDEQQ